MSETNEMNENKILSLEEFDDRVVDVYEAGQKNDIRNKSLNHLRAHDAELRTKLQELENMLSALNYGSSLLTDEERKTEGWWGRALARTHNKLKASEAANAALRRELSDLTRERPMSEAPVLGKQFLAKELRSNDRTVLECMLNGVIIHPSNGEEADLSWYVSWSYAIPLPATGGTEK